MPTTATRSEPNPAPPSLLAFARSSCGMSPPASGDTDFMSSLGNFTAMV